jgi:branched-chain amino acid transport system substrate-binding protein
VTTIGLEIGTRTLNSNKKGDIMGIRASRLGRGVGLVLSLSLLWAAPGAAAEKVFKLGVVGAYTGPSSQNGAEFKASVTMALEKIQYQIGEYKIEPVWIDEQNDPAKASSAYAEAIERSGIQAGILDWTTTASMPIMDLTAQYKVPHMFTEGASSIINDKYNSDKAKYSYWGGKFWPVPSKLVVGYVDCLNDAIERGLWKPQSKLVAIYGEDTDWGRNAGVAYKAAFEKAGWKVVSEDYAPTTQTDFYPLLAKYKKAGVSVLAGTANAPPFMSAFIKQTAEVGLKAAIIADGVGWIGDWYKLTGPSSNFVLDMVPLLTSPAALEWSSAVEKKYGFKPSPSAGGFAYDATNFFIKIAKRAIEEYKVLDKESIYKVMTQEVNTGELTFTKADGAIVMEEYKFTPESMPDAVVGQKYYYFPVIQYTNGQGKIVHPANMRQQDFQVRP